MSMRCIGEPVSWLRLELFIIGELAAAERQQVASHLEQCAPCRSCLEFAQRPPAASSAGRPLAQPATPRAGRRRWPLLTSAAALAAASLLLIVQTDITSPTTPESPPARIAIKGGELAIQLVRERDGTQTTDPQRFASHDRFRVLLTCPGGRVARWELIVYQADEVYFPLDASPVACANAVALPGAFRLSGQAPATVCLLLDPPAHDRLRAARPSNDTASDAIHTPTELPDPHVCTQLVPD
jgi:hypothetical protein